MRNSFVKPSNNQRSQLTITNYYQDPSQQEKPPVEDELIDLSKDVSKDVINLTDDVIDLDLETLNSPPVNHDFVCRFEDFECKDPFSLEPELEFKQVSQPVNKSVTATKKNKAPQKKKGTDAKSGAFGLNKEMESIFPYTPQLYGPLRSALLILHLHNLSQNPDPLRLIFKGIVYFKSIELCDKAGKILNDNGIDCFKIHSNNSESAKQVVEFSQRKEPGVLLAVKKLTYGFDCKSLAWEIIAAKPPKENPESYIIQTMGRVIRPDEDKIGYVLTFNNIKVKFIDPILNTQNKEFSVSANYQACNYRYVLKEDGRCEISKLDREKLQRTKGPKGFSIFTSAKPTKQEREPEVEVPQKKSKKEPFDDQPDDRSIEPGVGLK